MKAETPRLDPVPTRRPLASHPTVAIAKTAAPKLAAPKTVVWSPAGLCVVVLALLTACGRPGGEQQEVQTVDIPPPLTIEIESDQQAAEREPELVGILPGDFPEDLPIYLPASLIDFGSADGAGSVTLITPHTISRVRDELQRSAAAEGWSLEVDEAAGALTLQKGSRRARIRITNSAPGTTYQVEY